MYFYGPDLGFDASFYGWYVDIPYKLLAFLRKPDIYCPASEKGRVNFLTQDRSLHQFSDTLL
jgi:hypothetical protein